MTDIAALHEHMMEMNQKVSVWADKVNREFQRIWDFNQTEPGRFQEQLQEKRRLAKRAAGEDPGDDVLALIDMAAWLYVQANDRDRAAIRTMFADNRSIQKQLYPYIGKKIADLRTDGSEECVLLALLAASMEDQQTDTRDLHLHLIDLRKAAIEHHIDINRYLSKVAQLSSDQPPSAGRGTSTQEFLQSFVRRG